MRQRYFDKHGNDGELSSKIRRIPVHLRPSATTLDVKWSYRELVRAVTDFDAFCVPAGAIVPPVRAPRAWWPQDSRTGRALPVLPILAIDLDQHDGEGLESVAQRIRHVSEILGARPGLVFRSPRGHWACWRLRQPKTHHWIVRSLMSALNEEFRPAWIETTPHPRFPIGPETQIVDAQTFQDLPSRPDEIAVLAEFIAIKATHFVLDLLPGATDPGQAVHVEWANAKFDVGELPSPPSQEKGLRRLGFTRRPPRDETERERSVLFGEAGSCPCPKNGKAD